MKISLFAYILLISNLLIPIAVLAETPQSIIAHIDYSSAKISVKMESTRRSDVRNRLSQTSRQSTELGLRFPNYLPLMLSNIQVDSKYSFSELMRANPNLQNQVSDWASQQSALSTRPNATLNGTISTWEITLFPSIHNFLIDFGFGSYATEFPQSLVKKENRLISSIVIYAPLALPWHGMQENSFAIPALYPALKSEDTLNFFTLNNAIQKWVNHWGAVQYTSEDQLIKFEERLGKNPFYLRPKGIYGNKPVDFILSAEDCRIILASDSGRKALQECRIIIILAPDKLQHEFLIDP